LAVAAIIAEPRREIAQELALEAKLNIFYRLSEICGGGLGERTDSGATPALVATLDSISS
jgi:hypothetical protein